MREKGGYSHPFAFPSPFLPTNKSATTLTDKVPNLALERVGMNDTLLLGNGRGLVPVSRGLARPTAAALAAAEASAPTTTRHGLGPLLDTNPAIDLSRARRN